MPSLISFNPSISEMLGCLSVIPFGVPDAKTVACGKTSLHLARKLSLTLSQLPNSPFCSDFSNEAQV